MLAKGYKGHGIAVFELGSDVNRFHQSSAGELANRDQEIPFGRSNISNL